jgi:hypothetical protein
MDLGWKLLIPITLFNLIVTGGFVCLGLPQIALAACNWVVLGVIFWMGSKKQLKKADLPTPIVAAALASRSSEAKA